QRAAEESTPALSPAIPLAVDGRGDPAVGERPGTWSLRMGGWYIRLDGVAVDRSVDPDNVQVVQHTALAANPVPRMVTFPKLSPFDPMIVSQASAAGIDWRLVVAIISEESGFDPNSRSDSGAYGLMQVRPVAAEEVGETNYTEPADNVRTGARYLRYLDDVCKAASGAERLSLVLAAYNMGPGHVRDAQEVARQFGYDPNRWRGTMEFILPLLEVPIIYAELPNGFARGR